MASKPIAVVRIRISDLALDWLQAVTDLIDAVYAEEDVSEAVLSRADRVVEVMRTPTPVGDS